MKLPTLLTSSLSFLPSFIIWFNKKFSFSLFGHDDMSRILKKKICNHSLVRVIQMCFVWEKYTQKKNWETYKQSFFGLMPGAFLIFTLPLLYCWGFIYKWFFYHASKCVYVQFGVCVWWRYRHVLWLTNNFPLPLTIFIISLTEKHLSTQISCLPIEFFSLTHKLIIKLKTQ